MHGCAVFYLAGVLIALAIDDVPGTAVAALMLLAAIALLPVARLAGALLAGFAWGALSVGVALNDRLEAGLESETVALGGVVTTFAHRRDRLVAFEFHPRTAGRGLDVQRLPRRIAVTWSPAVAAPPPGAWCELHLRLRRPRGLANPGVSDRERDLLVRGVGATGRVAAHPGNLCVDIAPPWSLAYVRARVSAAIARTVPDRASAAVIRALAVADRSGLEPRQWAVMRATGTGHLLAISGLHVSLVAAWSFFVLRFAAGCAFAGTQAIPAVRLAWAGALVAACGYAALAGFGVPARRAAIMVGIAALASFRGHRILSSENLACALIVVATLDPLAVLTGGFWLSFCAAGILVGLSGGRRAPRRALATVWQRHVALAIGLAPVTLVLFGEVSLSAPLANLVAVPYCAIFVVPLSVAGVLLDMVSGSAAAVAWTLASHAWMLLWPALETGASLLPPIGAAGAVSPAGAALCLAGLALLSLPRGTPGRLIGTILVGAALLPRQPWLAPGEFRLDVIDVGQGLAVVIETRDHALLYDAGPSWWGSDRDAGGVVVLPVLRTLGIRRLDMLIVSHADADHAGGVQSVLAGLPVDRLLRADHGAGLAASGPPPELCRAPDTWVWDGVRFELLLPRAGDPGTRNDRSCVLRVAGAGGLALLPGDIEAAGEARLVAQYGPDLRADVVIVPHHGSATSSGQRFVDAVQPAYALVSTGHGNRFGFPDGGVVSRYRAAGAEIFDTAQAGMIRVSARRAGIRVRDWRTLRGGFPGRPVP